MEGGKDAGFKPKAVFPRQGWQSEGLVSEPRSAWPHVPALLSARLGHRCYPPEA